MRCILQGFDRVILVGHSYGTLLVNRLASEQHASIAAVVLIGAGYPDSKTARMRWIFRLPLFVRSPSLCIINPSINVRDPSQSPLLCINDTCSNAGSFSA